MPLLTATARTLACAGVVACLLGGQAAAAAPVLTSAEAQITFSAPTICAVTLTLAVTGAADVEHRLETLEGSRTTPVEVQGAERAGDVRTIGRTQSLVVRPQGAAYTLRYTVTQPDDRPYRCPLWLPAVPADGRSRNVRLRVGVPFGTSANGTMPSFAWTGTAGEATLGHLPAFVIVPFAAAGGTRPWDVSRVMDAAALGTLVLASAVWLRRQKGRA